MISRPALLAFDRVVLDFCWCSVFPRSARKNRTQRMGSTILPFVLSEVEGQAESAPNVDYRVSPVMLSAAKHLQGIAEICFEGASFVQHDNGFTRTYQSSSVSLKEEG